MFYGEKWHNAIRGPKSRYINSLCLRPWVAVMGEEGWGEGGKPWLMAVVRVCVHTDLHISMCQQSRPGVCVTQQK